MCGNKFFSCCPRWLQLHQLWFVGLYPRDWSWVSTCISTWLVHNLICCSCKFLNSLIHSSCITFLLDTKLGKKASCAKKLLMQLVRQKWDKNYYLVGISQMYSANEKHTSKESDLLLTSLGNINHTIVKPPHKLLAQGLPQDCWWRCANSWLETADCSLLRRHLAARHRTANHVTTTESWQTCHMTLYTIKGKFKRFNETLNNFFKY